MLLDSIKRLFGFDTGRPNEPVSNPAERAEDRLVPFRPSLPPDINQIESEFGNIHELMEHQMKVIMNSFGFPFGSPFAGFGFGGDFGGHPSRPFHPDVINFLDDDALTQSPAADHAALDPRDEVLKPQFRSKSSDRGNGPDQPLDDRLEFGGFPNLLGGGLFRSGPFGPIDMFGFESAPESGSMVSTQSVTIYSNVNGRRSMEKITRHPDGKIERTVINDDGDNIS